jgi:small-conductance mechanosensitive channel
MGLHQLRSIQIVVFLVITAVGGRMLFAQTGTSNRAITTAVSDQRTDAERIAGAKRLIANDTRRQQTLSQSAEQFNLRFEKLADRFTELDRRRSIVTPVENRGTDETQTSIDAEWTSARDNLDQLIRHRKLVQQQLKTLNDKLQLEQDYLRRLTQPDLSDETTTPLRQISSQQASVVPPSPSPLLTSMGLPAPPVVASPASPNTPPTGTPTGNGVVVPATSSLSDTDERVVAAKKDLDAKQSALRASQERLRFVTRSIDVFERDLKNSRAILADAEQQAIEDSKQVETDKSAAVADADAAVQYATSQEELAQAKESLKTETIVIAETEAMLQRLHGSRDKLVKEVAEAESALSNAQNWTLLLESPLSPSRVVRWLTDHGPKVASVLVVTMIMLGIARLIERRILTGLVQRRSTKTEYSGRAETLRRVFHSFTNFTILTLGALGALDQAGVNVTVLLGGAAVLGAAIAFGSQHLIRDFFSGFMILIENQYSVGHVVSINTKAGLVEDITLRMTVLRDEEGIVHFIPHSEATIVSNMTYGWARAVFDIAIDYREDVDRVMRVLMTLAREMRSDPQYGMLIIDNPELQGVDRLSDTAVRIKFLIKTQPIQQWNVKRELLRRIKNKFDELGIAFAFPQYQVHLNAEQPELENETAH